MSKTKESRLARALLRRISVLSEGKIWLSRRTLKHYCWINRVWVGEIFARGRSFAPGSIVKTACELRQNVERVNQAIREVLRRRVRSSTSRLNWRSERLFPMARLLERLAGLRRESGLLQGGVAFVASRTAAAQRTGAPGVRGDSSWRFAGRDLSFYFDSSPLSFRKGLVVCFSFRCS